MDIVIQQGINNMIWKHIKKKIELNYQHCSYDSSSGVLTIIPYTPIEHIDLKIVIEDDVLKDCHLEDSLFEI